MPASPPPSPAPRCRVVVVDDHVALLEMLCEMIDALPGFEIVGRAEDSVSAVAVCARERPDLAVLDLALQPSSGIAVLAQLRRMSGDIRVLVYSGFLHPSTIRRALRLGACGLVEKVAPLEEFRAALKAVSLGRVFYSRVVSDLIRRMVGRQAGPPPAGIALNDREKAVLRCLAEGLSSKETAGRLGLSVHTVVGLRMRLMEKTGRRGVALLSRYAADVGLVAAEDSPVELPIAL